jgi:hypothetical protein
MHFDVAKRIAEKYFYHLRRVAPLTSGEVLTRDRKPNRLDVETSSTVSGAIVIRYVGRG